MGVMPFEEPAPKARTHTAARALRLIQDGAVDREGVTGLAARLGYSADAIRRLLKDEFGAGPLSLAHAQRVRTARLLVEASSLFMTEAALTAGYSSLRAFEHSMRQEFGFSPREMRLRSRECRQAFMRPPADAICLQLPFTAPLNPDNLFGHLAATSVRGVEEWRDGAYRRTLRLPHGHAVVSLAPWPQHVACRLFLTDLRDLDAAIGSCRRLLDLDVNPIAVDARLREDPVLAPLVHKAPGRRVPGAVDSAEFAVRAVLGQQVSTAAARTHAARLVEAHGVSVPDPEGELTHLFPTSSALATLDPKSLALPKSRRTTLTTLVDALARCDLDLDPKGDHKAARAGLAALPGIGPWTLEVIAMRALGDPDAFPSTDLGVKKAAKLLALPAAPAALVERSRAWRPWRAYATQYLWATDSHPINFLPKVAGSL